LTKEVHFLQFINKKKNIIYIDQRENIQAEFEKKRNIIKYHETEKKISSIKKQMKKKITKKIFFL